MKRNRPDHKNENISPSSIDIDSEQDQISTIRVYVATCDEIQRRRTKFVQ
jgi:hypothetical protein